MKTDEENGEQTHSAEQTVDVSETRSGVGQRRTRRREKEGERGVQYGTAVVTMANAAWCDVSLAAELS